MSIAGKRKAGTGAASRTARGQAPAVQVQRPAAQEYAPAARRHAPTASPRLRGALTGCAEGTWLAMVLAAPVAMNPAGARIFEAAKLSLLMPLAALLLAVLLGVAWLRRKEGAAGGRGASPALWAFVAFFAFALLATAASELSWIAFFGDYQRREGLLAWLVAALPGAAMLVFVRSGAPWRRMLDALLLASVAPCVYTLLQRYGWVAGTAADWALAAPLPRPGGTLGNPVFFGDYMMLLLPLALARALVVWRTGAVWSARAPWLVLAGLQLWVLLLTQSRAPQAAALVALWLAAVLLGARIASWRLVGAAFGVVLLAALGLAAINLVPPITRLAIEVPGVQRFVFGYETLSAASRAGIWQAGVESLRAMPVVRMITGYGLDAGYLHYFAHLPASVLQIEGQLQSIDRLHNEVMELAASVGWPGLVAYMLGIGWLLHGAGVALGGDGQRKSGWFRAYAVAPWAAGALLALVMWLMAGEVGIAAVAFGVGTGVAWAGLLCWSALHRMRARAEVAAWGEREIMLATLAGTVLAFWLDAQISLPVMTTRMVFFTEAALLLLLLRGVEVGRVEEVQSGRAAVVALPVWPWGAAVALLAAMPAFFPAPFALVARVPAFSADAWGALPLAVLLLFAWMAGLADVVHDEEQAQGTWGKALMVCVLPGALSYVALPLATHALWPQAPDLVLALPVAWIWLWLPACCLIWMRITSHAVGSTTPMHSSLPALAGGAFPVVLLALALGYVWTELRADILVRMAGWSQLERKYEQALDQVARASALQPRERNYLMTMGTRRLQHAVEQLRAARGGEAAQFMFIADELRRAEADLRAAQALAPGDPWAALSLANVVQIEGMRALRPLMGEETGAARAAEARRLFERAHALFPVQTTVLRNWAQLEFDSGDSARAYALLDQMERLAPASEEPYVERLLMARQAGDAALFQATLARARQHLAEPALVRLHALVPMME